MVWASDLSVLKSSQEKGTGYKVARNYLILRIWLLFCVPGYIFNPLTPELNPSEQGCPPEFFFTGDLNFNVYSWGKKKNHIS
jgi:hypothetical protein